MTPLRSTPEFLRLGYSIVISHKQRLERCYINEYISIHFNNLEIHIFKLRLNEVDNTNRNNIYDINLLAEMLHSSADDSISSVVEMFVILYFPLERMFIIRSGCCSRFSFYLFLSKFIISHIWSHRSQQFIITGLEWEYLFEQHKKAYS